MSNNGTNIKRWSDLVGEHTLTVFTTDVRHPFDTDANGFAIELDDITIFGFEDPSDGYRSTCAEPLVARVPMYSFGHSPDYLHIPVLVSVWTNSSAGNPDGLEFFDRRNGNKILTIGTDNSDDYYPFYTCEWLPQNIAENEGK